MLRIDWNLLYTIINLLVLYLLMRKFLFKPISDVMEKRQQIIDESLLNAEESEKRADELKSHWEEEVKTVKEKSALMLEEARNDAHVEYDRIVGEAGKEAERIVIDARSNMDMERKQVLSGAKSEIAELAINAAAKILGESSTDEMNKSMYDKFLTEAGDDNDDTDRN